jgi:predicted nucleic acid-binding protein
MNEDFIEAIRSDDLSKLRAFFEKCEAFRESIAPIFQLEVIVDANVIISDLIWLVKVRRYKQARTRLQELIDSETILAYAPSVLKAEVSKHLSSIAKKEGLAIEDLAAEWQEYANKIVFEDLAYQPANLPPDERDPDDLPYIKLQQRTGARIYTKDKDISAMGGVTIGYTVIAHLRDYSRHAAIEYTIKYQGVVIAVLSKNSAKLLFSFIKSLAISARKLPSWVWFVACGVLIVGLLNPTSRNLIVTWISSLPVKAMKIGLKVVKFTEPFVLEHQKAQEKAIAALNAVGLELQGRNVQQPFTFLEGKRE